MSQYKVKIKYMQPQLCPVKIYLSDRFPPSFSLSPSCQKSAILMLISLQVVGNLLKSRI